MALKNPRSITISKKAICVLVLCVLSMITLGVYAGYALGANQYKDILNRVHITREANSPYKFIGPLLNVVFPKEVGAEEFAPLMSQVQQTINNQQAGALDHYSVYFRDLTTGHWAGINENDEYNPASLLKIVIAIAVYKKQEEDPTFFNRPLTYTQSLAAVNAQFPFAPGVSLHVGQSYTPPILIEKMLSESDNASKDLLFSALSSHDINEVYTDLLVQKPNYDDSSNYTISALDYSRFFRILYNGTYLTHTDSDALLKTLSETTFTQGLVSGVPATTPVAHKFGEHVLGTDVATGVELHDCGIVYHTKKPYFLCVMTSGSDEKMLTQAIADISKTVYANIDAKK